MRSGVRGGSRRHGRNARYSRRENLRDRGHGQLRGTRMHSRRWARKRGFISIYSRSPSLTLLPELHLLSSVTHLDHPETIPCHPVSGAKEVGDQLQELSHYRSHQPHMATEFLK